MRAPEGDHVNNLANSQLIVTSGGDPVAESEYESEYAGRHMASGKQ